MNAYYLKKEFKCYEQSDHIKFLTLLHDREKKTKVGITVVDKYQTSNTVATHE